MSMIQHYDTERAKFAEWFSGFTDMGELEEVREFVELLCWQSGWEAGQGEEAYLLAKQMAWEYVKNPELYLDHFTQYRAPLEPPSIH